MYKKQNREKNNLIKVKIRRTIYMLEENSIFKKNYVKKITLSQKQENKTSK